MNTIEYPDFLYPGARISFMELDKSFQEFLIRWYYYDHTDESEIPATVPVENIEAHIAEHMTPANMWCAKGFSIAREIDQSKDNLDFKNDPQFQCFCIYIARVCYEFGLENQWYTPQITKKEFLENCHPFRKTHGIRL